eukprot:160896_1
MKKRQIDLRDHECHRFALYRHGLFSHYIQCETGERIGLIEIFYHSIVAAVPYVSVLNWSIIDDLWPSAYSQASQIGSQSGFSVCCNGSWRTGRPFSNGLLFVDLAELPDPKNSILCVRFSFLSSSSILRLIRRVLS